VSNKTINAGEIWQDRIINGLRNTHVILAICSPFSITRPWVNFENGMVSFLSSDISIVPICHSGMGKTELPPYFKSDKAIDIQNPKFEAELIAAIKQKDNSLKTNHKVLSEYGLTEKINNAIKNLIWKEDKKKDDEYLLFTLNKPEDNSITIEEPIAIGKEITRDMSLKRIRQMKDFLKDGSTISCVGLAVGIQNCLFDFAKNGIYVGVRMKATLDAESTSVGVAKGQFNTGYELLKRGNKRIDSVHTLQDLFVSKGRWIKRAIASNQQVLKCIKDKIGAAGGRLWEIKFPDESSAMGTIFINHSRKFPRFEIGIWKYIDISGIGIENGKDIYFCHNALGEEEKDAFLIHGFGEDVFADYRGQKNIEDMKPSYWIWAKDGEIFYWTFPEERLIPRYKPCKQISGKDGAFLHSVLVSQAYMQKRYGNPVKYTPFVSDEDLWGEEVIDEQFSFPARALLSCF
jgi:hypothetical protein